jgi:hypothetical protein
VAAFRAHLIPGWYLPVFSTVAVVAGMLPTVAPLLANEKPDRGDRSFTARPSESNR